MNTLYLRIPPKHIASWPHTALGYAVCTHDGSLVREGSSTLSELSSFISNSTIVLLVAAPDVTLLELTIPPMPDAKLKLALPNLVEDQLVCDAAECVLLLGARSDATNLTPKPDPQKHEGSKRVIAVAQRSWLQQLSASLFALGANQIRAFPDQLCVPLNKGQASACIYEDAATGVCLALRFNENAGVGMLMDAALTIDEYVTTIAMLAPPGPVVLYVAAKSIGAYRNAISANPAWQERFSVSEATWSGTIGAAKSVNFNLMAGLHTAQTHRIQWKLWRWPLILASLVLVVNIGFLNYDYWSLKREAQSVKQAMLQTYRTAFPKESVILFPLEQMRKNLDLAERTSGQASADDFTMLLTQLGSVWSSPEAGQIPKLVSIEYKDHALLLQVKGELPQKQIQPLFDEKGLVLKKNSAETWQVRNAK